MYNTYIDYLELHSLFKSVYKGTNTSEVMFVLLLGAYYTAIASALVVSYSGYGEHIIKYIEGAFDMEDSEGLYDSYILVESSENEGTELEEVKSA